MVSEALASVVAVVGLLRLAAYITRHRIDVIHTTDRPRDALACVLLSKLTRARSIIHCHVAYGDWMSSALKWSLRHADALVGVSQFVAGTLVEAGHDPARVRTVLNAIEPERWVPRAHREETRRDLGIAVDDLMVLTVCRLFPEKGPAELIKACAALRAERPNVRLVIAGTDVTRDHWFSAELRRLVDELDVGDAVTFLGHRPEVAPLFAAADVFAMPSHGEPFGLVFLESMAMRVPVVGVADGGTLEVVEDGRNGLLVPYGDLDALVASLGRLLDDVDLRSSMGEYGRRTVIERFAVKRMADDAAAVYAALDAGSSNHGRGPGATARSRMMVANGVVTRAGGSVEDVDPWDVEACRRRLDDDGYVVFRDIVSADRLRTLGDAIAGEYAAWPRQSGELFKGGGSLTGHLNCFPGERSRFVYDELESLPASSTWSSAVRPDIVDRLRATMNFNLPGSVAQHYHTDGLYTEEFLICNVAVVDTDCVNGALDVLPGTHAVLQVLALCHRAQVPAHRLGCRCSAVTRSCASRRCGTAACPTAAPLPRPMMAITFGESGAPDGDPFEVNDGVALLLPELVRARAGSVELRERAYVKAPITYSAYRFVRSLYGNKGYSSW